jgi:formylglycine-generating enzyme required for sulfatase activity/Tol biopolymer transport system component
MHKRASGFLHPLFFCASAWVGVAAAAAEPAWKDVTLSVSEGTWMSLDVSPDGKTIAFDLLNDIHVMPASGGEARAIHTGPAVQRSPQFSPDGAQLLYLSDASGADNLWISGLDGANPRQLSKETLAMITGPAWAPDGRSVLATRTSATVFEMRTSAIHRYSLATGADEQIVEPPESGKDLQEPRLSPDGRFLYYTERRGGEHYVYVNTGLANFLIRRKDLQTGASVDLIAGFGGATTPQVSPDGRSVAFIRRVQAKTVLFRYDVASRTQHPVFQELDRDLQADYIPQEHYYPAFDWFPDNRHVAIWGKGRLLRVDMHTGQAQQIPFHATATHRIHAPIRPRQDAAPERVEVKIIQQPALAPAGNEIVFRALGALWRQDFAGKRAPRRLTSSQQVAESEPTWSADGRQIAFVEWDDERGSSLKVRAASGSRESIVAQSRSMIREPVFSRDGKRIAYRIMEPDSSLGGAADPAGLYIVGADGKNGRFLASATGVAQFSVDDRRVYFFGAPDYYGGKAVVLQSIGVDGGAIKDHAHAQTADTGDFTLSPDFKWIAFKELNQLYVMPYGEGAASLAVTAAGNTAARQLTETGAYEPVWSADSARLAWMLGRDLFVTTPEATGLVRDPLRSIALSAKTDVPEGVVAFVNARILPMTDQQIIERGVVVVERNRIKSVGAADSVAVPPGAKVIDLDGKTLMPGLFDAHGHIDCCFLAGVMPVKQPARYAALAYGVTTNFDPYSNELTSYESTEMTLAGANVGPRWLSSGSVIYGRSGKPDRVYNRIANIEDARNIVRRKLAIGGNILKSYKLTTRQQKRDLLRAAAEHAVMVDAEGAGHYYDNVTMILDGYTNLEHNLPVATYYDDLLQLFRNSTLSNTPTLIVTFGELFGESYIYQHQEPWKESKVRTYIPGVNNAYNPITGAGDAPLHVRAMQSIHYADELYDIGFRSVGRSVKRLDDAGVTINVGSHGQAPGIAMHWEMQLLAEGGMAPLRILRAATLNGAKTYGLDHQLGSIEPGKLADLIVLDQDPLADIRNTNSVRYTMINGRLYDAETLNEIGNYDRPRSKFFWEVAERNGIDWSPAWIGESAAAGAGESKDCAQCPQMVTVPAGSYQMGKNIDYGYGDMDGPTHTVTLSQPFELAGKEVTLAEYRAFMRETRHVPERKCNVYKKDAKWYIDPQRSWDDPGFEQQENHPVVCVSWRDAQVYIDWLNRKSGRRYRLPSEAEWEYVAALADLGDSRAGGGVTHENANIGKPECCGGETGGRDVWTYTAPVGSFAADKFGLHDIRGNVWEWQSDCYEQDYLEAPMNGSARETCSASGYRVVRGASYGDGGEYLSERLRLRGTEDHGYFTVGFRLAHSLEPAAQAPGEVLTSAQIARPIVEMMEATRQRNVEAVDRQLARSIAPEILYYWGERVSGRPAIQQWHREWFAETGWSLGPEKIDHVLHDGRQASVSYAIEYVKSAERKFRIYIAATLVRENDGWKVARIQQTLLEGPK